MKRLHINWHALEMAFDDNPNEFEIERVSATGKELTSMCQGVSHSAVFQADSQAGCWSAKETTVGCSSTNLGRVADGVERRR